MSDQEPADRDEGRCPHCHHIRPLHNGVMVLHVYLGSAVCEGTGQPPTWSLLEVPE